MLDVPEDNACMMLQHVPSLAPHCFEMAMASPHAVLKKRKKKKKKGTAVSCHACCRPHPIKSLFLTRPLDLHASGGVPMVNQTYSPCSGDAHEHGRLSCHGLLCSLAEMNMM